MTRLGTAVALVAAALAAAPAHAQIKNPTSAGNGSMRIAWQEQIGHTSRAEGDIEYTIHGRLRNADEAETWVPGATPHWTDVTRRLYGYFLRSTVTVHRFSQTIEQTCDNGARVQTTTTVTGLSQPNALLEVNEPHLNLGRRTGSVDLDLAFAVQRDGVFRYGQAVFASGIAQLRTTGQDCSGYQEDVGSAPGPVDRTFEDSVDALLGLDISAGVIDGFDSFAGQVTSDGALLARGSGAIPVAPREGESASGTLTVALDLGGPPSSQRAFCELPSDRALARAGTLRAARALLRRYGFPKVPYGGRRPSTTPRGRFFVDNSSGTGWCGEALGTRRHPQLFRSRGIVS